AGAKEDHCPNGCGGECRGRNDLRGRRDEVEGRPQRPVRRYPRHPRARSRRPYPGRAARAARDARVLGRSGDTVSSRSVRLRKEIPVLLRGRIAIGTDGADAAAHGTRAGVSYGRRLPRMEGSWRRDRYDSQDQIIASVAYTHGVLETLSM